MPVKKATSHRLGPGSLKFGATGSEVEFAAQLRSCKIDPKSKAGDPLPVLSGEQIDASDEVEWTVSGKILEEYSADSLQVWAHQTAGQVVPFIFRPDNDKSFAVTGSCRVAHIGIGGDVKERNEQDFEFAGVGMYDLVDPSGVSPTPFPAYSTTAEVDDPSDL